MTQRWRLGSLDFFESAQTPTEQNICEMNKKQQANDQAQCLPDQFCPRETVLDYHFLVLYSYWEPALILHKTKEVAGGLGAKEV